MITGTLGPGVRYAFTDRRGGRSPAPFDSCNLGGRVGDAAENVLANRDRVAATLGFDPTRVVFLHQVHGADVVVADGTWPADPPPADGVATRVRGLGLAVVVADCTPVLVADAEAGVVGAAHAGRSGLVRGVASALLVRMHGLGASVERCVAVIGPAVCGGCYEVPAAMQAEVAAVAPAARALTRQGTASLDIPAGVAEALRGAGVPTVTRVAACTMELPEYFSHRRDGPQTGRSAGYVWLEP